MSSFKSLPTLPKSDGENPDHQSLEDFISYPKKLQQRLSNKIANDIAADNSQSERTAARLRSVKGQGAGGWLEVIPTSDKYAIRSTEFSLASHLRLGLALPFTNFINCSKRHPNQTKPTPMYMMPPQYLMYRMDSKDWNEYLVHISCPIVTCLSHGKAI